MKERASQRQGIVEDQVVGFREALDVAPKHGHVEAVAVVGDQDVAICELDEARPHLFQARGSLQVLLRVAVYLRRLQRDRLPAARERTERVHHPAAADLGGAELDDLAAGGIEIGGLDVEGHIVLKHVTEAASLNELKRFEQRGGQRSPGRRIGPQDQVAGARLDTGRQVFAGRRQLHGPEHPAGRDLDPAQRGEIHRTSVRHHRGQTVGQLAGRRKNLRIFQLVVPFLEAVLITLDALREQLVDEAVQRRVRLVDGPQVLDVIDEAPGLLAVRVSFGVLPRVGAHRAQQVAAAAGGHRPHLAHQLARQQPLGEGLQRQRVVVGRRHHAEGGDHVGDDRIVEQRAASRQAAGDAGRDEASLQLAPDLVPSVKDGVVTPAAAAGLAIGGDALEQPVRLGRLVLEVVALDLELRVALRLDLLDEQVGVLSHQSPRHREDLAAAAAVAIEDDGILRVEVRPILPEDARVRAAPGEDRLLVVAHREDVPVFLHQALEDAVLRGVQVLCLVHQQVVPARGHRLRHRRVIAEQPVGDRDDVVEVHQVLLAQHRQVAVEKRIVALGERITLQPVAAEEGEQGAVPLGRPDAQAPQDQPLVLFVGHPESAPQTDRLGVLAKDVQAERVQRPSSHAVGAIAQPAVQAGRDLFRRLVGEGDRADALGREALLLDQVLDAADQAERLAGAGPGEDEGRPQRRFDGGPLLGERCQRFGA